MLRSCFARARELTRDPDARSASIVCRDFDGFHQAWTRIKERFVVREGHGRLKNNLFDGMRPPDLLLNLVVEPPGMFAIIAEVQVHLLQIILLKEVSCARVSRHA